LIKKEERYLRHNFALKEIEGQIGKKKKQESPWSRSDFCSTHCFCCNLKLFIQFSLFLNKEGNIKPIKNTEYADWPPLP
jgi:hypothetical protein